MPQTAVITLASPGADTGPLFDLRSNANSYATIFDSGVPKTSLVTGYVSTSVPDAATIIRVQSTGTCTSYVDLPISGLPVTTTTSTTTTSTTTTTTAIPCECYTVTYTGPPPTGGYIGITNFSYVDCSGLTVNSSVGDDLGFPLSRNVCVQLGTIPTVTGGDELASVEPSVIDCCLPCVAVSFSYNASDYLAACAGTFVTYYLEPSTSALWLGGSGGCYGTNAPIGYYSDGTDFYYYDGDILNMGGSCSGPVNGIVSVYARNSVTSSIGVEIGYSTDSGATWTLIGGTGNLTTTLALRGSFVAIGGSTVLIGVRRTSTGTALGFNDAPATNTYPYCGWSPANALFIFDINGDISVDLKVNITGGIPIACS
jgi:hypothetical protein